MVVALAGNAGRLNDAFTGIVGSFKFAQMFVPVKVSLSRMLYCRFFLLFFVRWLYFILLFINHLRKC